MRSDRVQRWNRPSWTARIAAYLGLAFMHFPVLVIALLRWTRIAGRDGGIVFAPIKAEGADADPMYRWIELLERERTTRERGRLLYVAATRAKRHLHLLGAVKAKTSEEGMRLIEPRNGSMLRMLWHEVRPLFESLQQEPATLDLFAQPTTPRLRRMPLAWQPPQADAPVPTRATAMNVIDAQQRQFDWVTHTSRHIGTLVHRELDRMVRTGSTRADTASIGSDANRARLIAELSELGVPPDRCQGAAERVIVAVNQTLADERGRWLLGLTAGIGEAESELALSGVFQGEIVEGIIDRTFLDERGQRWIVDFKTSTHEGGGLDAFLDAEQEYYQPQLLRYARLMRLFRPGQPVRAALYFPLLRQWREVGVEE